MDLRGYLRAVRKNWWIVLVVTVIGVGGGLGLALGTAPTYQSTVSFFVSTPSDASGNALQSDQYAQARVNSYVHLLDSDLLADEVAKKVGNGLDPADVIQAVAGKSELNTVILTATVTDSSAQQSLDIARAISTLFGPMVNRLEDRAGDKTSLVQLNVTSGPTLNPVPVSPRKTLDVGLGFVVGVVLGAALAITRELLDNSVHTADDLAALVDRPVIGSVPFDKGLQKSDPDADGKGDSISAESYRQMRTNVDFLQIVEPLKVIVVTSAVAGEGKTQTAANLAIKFAELGRKVLLVQADLRHAAGGPDHLGLSGSPGLTNALLGQAGIDEVLRSWGDHGLVVLPSGDLPPNPSEMLASAQMGSLLGELRSRFDVILIDTPPVLTYSDARVVTQSADGVLFVVRQGKTPTRAISKALSSFEVVRDKVLGTVLNMAPVRGVDANR